MDISKLPKLSQTPPRSASSQAAQAKPVDDRTYTSAPPASAETGMEIWVSLILGVVFLFLGANFGRWSIAKITGQPFSTGIEWSTGNQAGQPVEYFDLQGGTAWGEMGFFVLGVSMLIEAAVMGFVALKPAQYRMSILAILAAVIAAMANGLAIAKIYPTGVLPLISVLALGLAGLMIFWHVSYLRTMNAHQAWRRRASAESQGTAA